MSQNKEKGPNIEKGPIVLFVVGLVIAVLFWLIPFNGVAESPLKRWLWPEDTSETTSTSSTRDGPTNPTDQAETATTQAAQRPVAPSTTSADPDPPPASDPGQLPLPSGAQRLGGIVDHLEGYCQQWRLHAALRYQNTWGWRCGHDPRPGIGWQAGDQHVSVDKACAGRYGDPVVSRYKSYMDPHSWSCYRT
jgi:hypothetical protein